MLTYEEYQSTMTNKMEDVTMTAAPVVDIWPYVGELSRRKIVSGHVYNNQLVEKVYRNDVGTYDHILLPTENVNMFVVVIVDLKRKEIKGHFCLDLNTEYGVK